MRLTKLGPLFISAVLLLPQFARSFDFGLKAGLNFAFQTDPKVIPAEYRMRMDFAAGGFLSFRLFGRFSLQPEVLLSREGANSSDSYYSEVVENQWKVSYLKVPILLKYRLGQGEKTALNVLFGPYLSYRLKATRVQAGFGETEEEDTTYAVWPGDYGLILGGSYEKNFGPGKLIFDVRFSYGLANTIFKGGYNDWVDAPADPSASRNRVFSILLGYGF